MSTKSYEYEDLWVMSTKTYECEESHRYLQLLCHTRLWGGAVAICVATGARSVVADGGARLFVICNLWNETGGKDRTCLDSCVLFVYKTEAWSCGWWCPFVCHQQFVKWKRGKRQDMFGKLCVVCAQTEVAIGGARLFVICSLWNEKDGRNRTCLKICFLFVQSGANGGVCVSAFCCTRSTWEAKCWECFKSRAASSHG
jgi:hypothetical protein